MKIKPFSILLTCTFLSAIYSCKKETKHSINDKSEPIIETESKRSNGNFIQTIHLKTFTSPSSDLKMGLVLFLNKIGIENKIDSIDVVINQKGNIQKLNAILLGEEGLSNYIFGNANLSPKIEPKEAFNIEINFFNVASKTLKGTKTFEMKIGTRSFNEDDKIISEKFIPGTYPICLMFDSSKINEKYVYNFTFVGLVVEADSTLKLSEASENSKNKKIIMSFGKNNKIPSDYLSGKGFYTDMLIMMYGINNLGPQFYNALNAGRNIDFVLRNTPYYWNAAGTEVVNFTSLEKIKKGGGQNEKRLKQEMQRQNFKK